MLLGAPGLTARNKKLLGAKGIATRSKDATSMLCFFSTNVCFLRLNCSSFYPTEFAFVASKT